MQACLNWYLAKEAVAISKQVSLTRDVFGARLDSFFDETGRLGLAQEKASLLTAIIGEIGNNCFDHNAGQWSDTPGCWFETVLRKDIFQVWIADRGRGIFSSLKSVDPNISTDQAALEIAFEKRISGRAPERRGNGLKFVRAVINGGPGRGLLCLSGSAQLKMGGFAKEMDAVLEKLNHKMGRGVFSLVYWDTRNENQSL
ncbi:MAG: hypothetical protein HY537_09130 [Deltaproteobacteria bacterium]|nr:hypothetical protein [Deltaproteobacteria bacterium]